METLELKPQTHVNFLTTLANLITPFKKKSTDPVELLPPRILNRIFSYLRGNDLLTISLVSRKWYRFIAKSATCMDKLKVVVAEPRLGCFQLFTMKDAILLSQQGRKYRHISFAYMDRQLLFQHKLLLASFPWHTVSLTHHTFKTKVELIDFLGMIEPFVEELTLRAIKFGRMHYTIGRTNFCFPHLHRLSIINCYTFLYTDPFKYVTTLRFLHIATDALPAHASGEELTERVKCIQMMLLQNINIHHLEMFIDQKDFDTMYMDERFLGRLQFNLRGLYVGRFKQRDNEAINVVQVNNFVNFLRSQESTLAILYMENWLGNATLEYAINDMQLKKLTIANLEPVGAHDESTANLNLFSNDSIEHLTLWTKSARHPTVAEEIVKVCRGVRTLEIRTINQRILEAIIGYNEDIELIICDFFSAYIPPEREVMRHLKCMVINVSCADNFRDLIGVKNYYTKFEVVFLGAAKELKRRWNLGPSKFRRY